MFLNLSSHWDPEGTTYDKSRNYDENGYWKYDDGYSFKVPDANSDVYSSGYYGELTESAENRNYLAWNPLFTLYFHYTYDDEHWRDYTYDELCHLIRPESVKLKNQISSKV